MDRRKFFRALPLSLAGILASPGEAKSVPYYDGNAADVWVEYTHTCRYYDPRKEDFVEVDTVRFKAIRGTPAYCPRCFCTVYMEPEEFRLKQVGIEIK